MTIAQNQMPALRQGPPLLTTYQDDPAPAQRSWGLDQMLDTATRIGQAGMFPGVKDPNAIYTLMLICDADQLHPMTALRRFHFFDNKIAMRAEWALARVPAQGGQIKWVETTRTTCKAHFSSTRYDPEGFTLDLKLDDFKHLLNKDNWKNNPAQMLRARCQTQGIKMIDPGVFAGIPMADEVEDMTAVGLTPPPYVPQISADAKTIDVTRPVDTGSADPAVDDLTVAGGPASGWDQRSYLNVTRDAAAELQRRLAKVYEDNGEMPAATSEIKAHWFHGNIYKSAFETGKTTRPAASSGQALTVLTEDVYPHHRRWLREQVNELVASAVNRVEAEFKQAKQQSPPSQQRDLIPAESREPGSDG